MEDVLEVYHRPYDSRRREPLPPAPGAGRALRKRLRPQRGGEPVPGLRDVKVTETRKRGDWAHFIRGLVDGRYKGAEKVVLVMDRLNTHATASLNEAFPPAEAQRIARRLEAHHFRSTAVG